MPVPTPPTLHAVWPLVIADILALTAGVPAGLFAGAGADVEIAHYGAQLRATGLARLAIQQRSFETERLRDCLAQAHALPDSAAQRTLVAALVALLALRGAAPVTCPHTPEAPKAFVRGQALPVAEQVRLRSCWDAGLSAPQTARHLALAEPTVYKYFKQFRAEARASRA